MNVINIKPERNEELIKGLTDLLESAKKGELQTLIFVGIDPKNGEILSGDFITKGTKIFELIGALAYLQSRLIKKEIKWRI